MSDLDDRQPVPYWPAYVPAPAGQARAEGPVPFVPWEAEPIGKEPDWEAEAG